MVIKEMKETMKLCCRDQVPFLSDMAALFLIMIAILALVRS